MTTCWSREEWNHISGVVLLLLWEMKLLWRTILIGFLGIQIPMAAVKMLTSICFVKKGWKNISCSCKYHTLAVLQRRVFSMDWNGGRFLKVVCQSRCTSLTIYHLVKNMKNLNICRLGWQWNVSRHPNLQWLFKRMLVHVS